MPTVGKAKDGLEFSAKGNCFGAINISSDDPAFGKWNGKSIGNMGHRKVRFEVRRDVVLGIEVLILNGRIFIIQMVECNPV